MASSNSDDTVDMDVLSSYLSKLAPRWIRIGVKLDQEACVREVLQAKDTSPNNCVAVVLRKWVESGKDVSWAKLCSVLRSVELEDVAEQIQVSLKFWGSLCTTLANAIYLILYWLGTCSTNKANEDDNKL